jgi:hypothetical protein
MAQTGCPPLTGDIVGLTKRMAQANRTWGKMNSA